MGFLERDAYVAQLTESLAEAGRGRGRLVLISGEAGIGKSALVDSFSAGRGGGDRVLWGTCDAVAPARPFAPLVDIGEQVGGDLREALRDGDRHRACDAFLHLLRSKPQPRIVVFEDLQWVDEATLDLLRAVGRRLRTISALVLGTYRDDEVGADHPLRLALGDVPATAVTTIRLPPLSSAAVRTMVEGTGIDGDALHAVAGGNPFFVTEVVAAGGDVVPATVRDAVWARASRLSTAGASGVASGVGAPSMRRADAEAGVRFR